MTRRNAPLPKCNFFQARWSRELSGCVLRRLRSELPSGTDRRFHAVSRGNLLFTQDKCRTLEEEEMQGEIILQREI